MSKQLCPSIWSPNDPHEVPLQVILSAPSILMCMDYGCKKHYLKQRGQSAHEVANTVFMTEHLSISLKYLFFFLQICYFFLIEQIFQNKSLVLGYSLGKVSVNVVH